MSHRIVDDAPPGFENYFEKNCNGRRQTFFRCKKTAFDPISKKNIQCSYKIRKDHFKGKKHDCRFLNLENFLHKNEILLPKEVNELYQSVFTLIGKKNLPISTAVSEEFYYLLKIFFEYGQSHGKEEFSNVYPHVSRMTFTKNFIINSNVIKSKLMKQYAGFASLAIDGGKVGNNSILNCILLNPLIQNIKPILYDGIYNFAGNYDSYIKEISRIVLELETLGIIITGIVTDNLKVQVIATDHRESRSFQKMSDNKVIKSILRVPCQCHVVSLALNDLKSTEFLGNTETILRKVIKQFRKKKFKKWIGEVCPNLCPTRWTNVFDILKFFLKKFQRLVCIIHTENPIVENEVDQFRNEFYSAIFCILPDTFGFMFLFNKLIHILEKNSTLAAECPMIYIGFFNKVNEFMGKMNNPRINYLGKLFVDSIKRRIIETGNFSLLLFLSTFLFEGRELVRKQYSNIININNDEWIISNDNQYFDLNEDESIFFNGFINCDYHNIINSRDEYQNHRKNLEFIESFIENSSDSSEFDDEIESEEIEINTVYNIMSAIDDSQDEEILHVFTESEETIDMFENYSPLEYCVIFFKEFANNNAISESMMIQINEAYIHWLISPISQILKWTRTIPNPLDMWNTLSFTNEWRAFSSIAIRYLTIPSSEAAAERMFSGQRLVISKHRYRTKKKLEESRMVFSSI